jgi:hypothetical protein
MMRGLRPVSLATRERKVAPLAARRQASVATAAGRGVLGAGGPAVICESAHGGFVGLSDHVLAMIGAQG